MRDTGERVGRENERRIYTEEIADWEMERKRWRWEAWEGAGMQCSTPRLRRPRSGAQRENEGQRMSTCEIAQRASERSRWRWETPESG